MSLTLDATTIQFGSLLKEGKPPNTTPPDRKNTIPPEPWAKSDTEKVELFPNHLAEVFTTHDNSPDPEVEREIASHNQPRRKYKYSPSGNILSSSKSYTHTGHPGPTLSQPKCYRKCPTKDIKLFCTFLTL